LASLAIYSVGLTLFFSVPFHVSDDNEITRPTGQDETKRDRRDEIGRCGQGKQIKDCKNVKLSTIFEFIVIYLNKTHTFLCYLCYFIYLTRPTLLGCFVHLICLDCLNYIANSVISTVSYTVHEYSPNAYLTQRMYPTFAWIAALDFLWASRDYTDIALQFLRTNLNLHSAKRNIKINFITDNKDVTSKIKDYFKTNSLAMSSIKAAAINITLVCDSNLKHLKKIEFNYKIFQKVAKRFKSLASPGSTSTIALNISKLLSDIPLDDFFYAYNQVM
jgi:hypothetical protein